MIAVLCFVMKKTPDTSSNSHDSTVISEGVKMTGDVAFEHPSVMNGKLKGRILSDDNVIIGKKGSVDGGIICGSCEIYGKTKGNIQSDGYILITGEVRGDLAAQEMEIRQGAHFKGALCVGGNETQWNSLWKNVKVWGHRILRKAKK